MSYVLLILGFLILIKAADVFVNGAVSLSKYLKISPLIIGLTVVAFGTSAPEASVSIISAINGITSISLGNVIGSNIINTTLIIGIAAMIQPIQVQDSTIKKEIPYAFIASIFLLLLILLGPISEISRFDGLLLLVGFVLFMWMIIPKQKKEAHKQEFVEKINHSLKISILYTIIGIAGTILGGELVSRNSELIALSLGLSETFVGLTIVALGTSLPELVTTITAMRKKQSDLAIGNIVGSNLFNILFILGTSAVITPIEVNSLIIPDVIFLITIMIFLFVFSYTGKKKLTRSEGIVLAVSYLLYIAYLLI